MPTTNFKNSSGTDIGDTLVEKSYLIDRYPELADTFKQAGLWAWGRRYVGIDSGGNDITTGLTSPVQAYGGKNNDWKLISSSSAGYQSHAAVKTDGTLWVWGNNINSYYYPSYPTGQVDGTETHKSTPVQMGVANTWKQVAASKWYWMAIKTDGSLWGQGDQRWQYYNDPTGCLGTGSNPVERYSSPVQTISGGTNWKSVVVGSGTTMAIKTDGTLWGWGYNQHGPLGDNTETSKSSPVQTVAGGTSWKQVTICSSVNCVAAIKTNGTLWTWGNNNYGTLANGDWGTGSNHTSSPAQVGSATTWKQVSAGSIVIGAIKTDGTLWTWGYNGDGALGDGTTNNNTQHGPLKSTPVQTISGGTNWKMVSAGNRHMMAIKTDGTLWSWGMNGEGQVGDGTKVDKSSPVQIYNGGTNWKTISSGTGTSLAIRDDSADIFGNTL